MLRRRTIQHLVPRKPGAADPDVFRNEALNITVGNVLSASHGNEEIRSCETLRDVNYLHAGPCLWHRKALSVWSALGKGPMPARSQPSARLMARLPPHQARLASGRCCTRDGIQTRSRASASSRGRGESSALFLLFFFFLHCQHVLPRSHTYLSSSVSGAFYFTLLCLRLFICR